MTLPSKSAKKTIVPMTQSFVKKAFLAALPLGSFALAAEGGEHALSSAPSLLWNPEIPFWPGHTLPISNSMLMFFIAVVFITIVLRLATRRMERIPHGLQNFVEWIFESLQNFLASLTGPYLARKYFWYFASVFLLILVSNYMGLLPGVGSITYNGEPIFRGAFADFGATLFMGVFYMLLWVVIVMKEQGPWHFITHTFGVKGGLSGILKYALMPIFFFVGAVEIFSIGIRPIAFAARLFGNIFAGESIIEKTSTISFAATFPFMCLELIVGFVQALVFLMLTAIFLKTQIGGDAEAEPASTTTFFKLDHEAKKRESLRIPSH